MQYSEYPYTGGRAAAGSGALGGSVSPMWSAPVGRSLRAEDVDDTADSDVDSDYGTAGLDVDDEIDVISDIGEGPSGVTDDDGECPLCGADTDDGGDGDE